MTRTSSTNTFVLSQTSVISPMGIQQDIVTLDDKLDDEDSFVVFQQMTKQK